MKKQTKKKLLLTLSAAFLLSIFRPVEATGSSIVLNFAPNGEIGTVANVEENASYIEEHAPGGKALSAHGTMALKGPYYAFKSRDFMGIANLKEVLAGLPAEQLTALDLTNTTITDDELSAVRRFKNLRRLDLENTDITDSGLEKLGSLVKLESLNVRKTKSNGACLSVFASCKNLKRLCIGNNDLNKKYLANCKAFNKLTWLEISQLHLRNNDLAFLSAFPELNTLYMADNNWLDDGAVSHLKSLKHLKILRCEGTEIGAGPILGLKIPLIYLRLDPRHIDKNQEALLLKACPKITIIKDQRKAEYYQVYKELVE